MMCKDCGNTQPALQGFPNHVFCDYYHLHMSNLADASRCEHFKAKILTTADRIRAMTDEELAHWLAIEKNCSWNDGFYGSEGTSENDLLSWLKSPVEVDNG